MARFTLNLLGWELDVTLGLAADAVDEDDPGRDLGYTGGTYIGFAPHTYGEDIALPQRVPPWDEPEERH